MTDTGSASDAQIVKAKHKYSEKEPLRLLYGGSIVVQLGSQLYPSVTAAVAELVSNAWDADARNVWVTVPFHDDWQGGDSTIQVLDDGVGMSRREAQFKYLVVGRERRVEEQRDRTPRGRLLHGRKGIGKLAAFGTGRRLEVVTQQSKAKPVGFRLDYERLRTLEPAESAEVEEVDAEPLTDPAGRPLAHGTRVRLAALQPRRRPSESRFMLSMRRRFSLDASEMKVFVNGEPLARFDMEFQYRFPKDAAPAGVEVGEDGLGIELVDSGDGQQREVRWWIGFTEKPVRDEILQGVSVLVRGKQAQRPFKFERTRGTQGQLGFEYLVGEVHADWIDDGLDEDDDLIASNRDALQLEDERLQPFIEWGRRRLVWALGERGRLQEKGRLVRWSTDMPSLQPVLRRVKARERQAFGRVAERLSRVEGIQDADVAEVMQRVLDVREHRTAEAIVQEIRALGDPASEQTWQMVEDAAALERRTAHSTVTARLALLELLGEMLGVRDTLPDLSRALTANPWLVDLRFDRSTTQALAADEDVGEALVLVGPPVWDTDAKPTVLAAVWDEARRPPYARWLAAVEKQADAHGAQPLLIGRDSMKADGYGTTWADCLTRSSNQHQAWLTLVGDGEA